ncbi:unnamed protein product [Cuscuta campestris]|uniref:Uncharacterized protein n=1 Tax=Cuscuta campestris TaxID=132261 RepID=A0A484L8E6_9ASTE|nr:unnamed protein product [Cuscuta campestris]
MDLPVFSIEKPESKSDEEWKRDHRQVCGFIRQYVGDNVYGLIANETHARSLWEKLESMYASKSGNNKLYLLKSLMNLSYKETTPLLDHLNAFHGILDQLSGVGIKLEDELAALWLLNTLPESWEIFRVSIINSAPDGIVSMQTVKPAMLNEEMRRKMQGSSSQSEVLVTEHRGRNANRDQRGRGKSRSKSKSRYKNVECHYCHNTGHIKKNCFKWKRDNKAKGKNEKEDEGGDRVSTADLVDDLIFVTDADVVNAVSDDQSWVIDSGATLHVTPRKEFFTSLKSGSFGKLKMGNDAVAEVVGIGDVCLETQMGYENHFGGGKWKLKRGNLVVARGKKESKLYRLESVLSGDVNGDVNAIESSKASHLWHRRLSHIGEKGLNLLAKKDVLPGLKNAELEKCYHCLAGKQTRISFKKHSSSRRAELLELVHSDVCGPLKRFSD